MGVNNLLSFLRQTRVHVKARFQLDLDRPYDIFVDLAIIVVPLMQRARNVAHFHSLLRETFTAGTRSDQTNRLVEVIVGARRVSMYLDMFSPKMKIETHNTRSVRREVLPNASGEDAAHCLGMSERGEAPYNEVNATTATLSAPYIDGASHGSPVPQHLSHQLLQPRMNVVKLRDVRSTLADIIVSALSESDPTIGERCTIDTEVVGEGEIKCFRSAIHRVDPQDVVILSNDNDIFLMMLVHQHKLLASATSGSSSRLATNSFYRVLINDSADQLYNVHIQKISVDATSVLHHIPPARRWCVLLWLICCSGTDFVSPLRPFSSLRRVEIFSHFLAAERAPRGSGVVVDNGRLSFALFLTELRRFVRNVEEMCSSPAANDPFSGRNTTTSTSSNDPSDGRCGNHVSSHMLTSSRSRLRSVFSVSAWVIRLYWNLLYIVDLPVDFFRRPMFETDDSFHINSYVPNVYLSFFLTSSVFRHFYDNNSTELSTAISTMLKVV